MTETIISLTDEELSRLSGGADTIASLTDITVVLEPGEDAASLADKLSLPLGLMLDAYSLGLLTGTIAPKMGTTGPRTLYATFSIKYPYVHVETYTIY